MIQDLLAQTLVRAVAAAQGAGALPSFEVPEPVLERPARREHGDWSTSLALACAKPAARKPRDVAEAIVAALPPLEEIATVEIAGPGFVNFFLSHAWLAGVVHEVCEAGASWGRTRAREPEHVNVEFVSANPTGPMHLGHARWAAVGDVLARALEGAGHRVAREFYINDAGTQMTKFGQSIAARYLEHHGRDARIPEGGYVGAYVTDLAREIAADAGDRWVDAPEPERTAFFRAEGERRMLAHQRATLERFGVRFDVWRSERSLHESGAVARALDALRSGGHAYERDGALWLRSTDFGDDKDRVVVRASGEPTYLAPDVAYYLDKAGRGFDRIVFLWGAGHHGYVGRLRAAVQALGGDPERVEFMVGQNVTLVRAGEVVTMSKRTGDFVTFDELIDETGVDAARYTFLRQGIDTVQTFDIDVVTAQTQDNPVYYVQYAHARICSIVRHAAEEGVERRPLDSVALEALRDDAELDLARRIAELPEVVEATARLRAPHRLTRYAEDLAAQFHAFYRDCRVLSDDAELTQARLALCDAARITLANTLAFCGVSAPERM